MKVNKTRLTRLSILFFMLVVLVGVGVSGDVGSENGKRIYREGMLSSGQPLQATVQGNLGLSGDRAACVNCHRRSGFGSSEGQLAARPVTSAALFEVFNAPHPKMSASVIGNGPDSSTRPAYTEETLARAIRDGVDAAGHPLNAAMPRFTLDEADMKSLVGYLNSLSAAPSPGVSDDTIHFATLVTDGVKPEKRRAMLEVLEAFVHDKNAGTRNETQRAERAGWDMEREYRAYRNWKVHVWELTGGPETWQVQLETHYREQPVFALLSGITSGPWQPVHDFCESREIPCLFPNVDAPPIADADNYSFYFSKGVILEAETLAGFLETPPGEAGAGSIVQVFRHDDLVAATAAKAFREAMKNRATGIVDIDVDSKLPLTADFWSGLAAREQPALLVLWLDAADLKELNAGAESVRAVPRIFLSSTLASEMLTLAAQGMKGKIRFLHPYELPGQLDRKLARTRIWLKVRNIEFSDPRIQANTFFALTQAGNAVMHLVGNFSRDYFAELVEHGVDNAIVTSVYPRLSLGPDQRYAAKRCAILESKNGQADAWWAIGP